MLFTILVLIFSGDVERLGSPVYRIRAEAHYRLQRASLLAVPALHRGTRSGCLERAVRCEQLLDIAPTIEGVAFWCFANADCRVVVWFLEDVPVWGEQSRWEKWWRPMVNRRISRISNPCFGEGIGASSQEFQAMVNDELLSSFVHLVAWQRVSHAVLYGGPADAK